MSKIESQIEIIPKSAAEVYDYLMVPANYKVLMPAQVRQFDSDDSSATLDIEGLGKLRLERGETRENEYIRLNPVKPVPVDFFIEWNITALNDQAQVQACMEASLNMFMKPIVEPLMRKLLTAQVSKLKELMS
jgi:hypothetical protein